MTMRKLLLPTLLAAAMTGPAALAQVVDAGKAGTPVDARGGAHKVVDAGLDDIADNVAESAGEMADKSALAARARAKAKAVDAKAIADARARAEALRRDAVEREEEEDH